MPKIKSVKYIGKHQAYDLEVDHPDHQFYLSNGVLSSNSHAVFYSMLGYHTAYLKAHYPLEFMVANLMSQAHSNAKSAKAMMKKIKTEIRKFGVKILPPNVNTSDSSYKIMENNILLTGFDALKSIEKTAIPELIKKRPFTSIDDFLQRIDATKVKMPSIMALAASGCLDDFGLTRKVIIQYAGDYRQKYKAWKNRKNKDAFSYEWPKEEEWNIPELNALEVKYLNEGLTGNKFEVYPGFFSSNTLKIKSLPELYPASNDNSYDNRHMNFIPILEGVIVDIFEFKVKKEDSKLFGKTMARFTLEDVSGDHVDVVLFPKSSDKGKDYLDDLKKSLKREKVLFEEGTAIKIAGYASWYDDNISVIYEGFVAAKSLPKLPKDMAAKKIKVKNVKRRTKKSDILNQDLALDVIEDAMIEDPASNYIADDDNYDEMEGF